MRPSTSNVSARDGTLVVAAAGPASSRRRATRMHKVWALLTSLGSLTSSFVAHHILRGPTRKPASTSSSNYHSAHAAVRSTTPPLPLREPNIITCQDGNNERQQQQQHHHQEEQSDGGEQLPKNASFTSIDSSFSSSQTLCSTSSSPQLPPVPTLEPKRKQRRVRFKLTEEELSRESIRVDTPLARAGTSRIQFHPLLAGSYYYYPYRACMSYDVKYAPSCWTILDPSTHSPIPTYLLYESATHPPVTGGTGRLVLRSDMFPWPVIVSCRSLQQRGRGRDHPPPPPPSSLLSSSSMRMITITNLDVLYAVHATLGMKVTKEEWMGLPVCGAGGGGGGRGGRSTGASATAVAVAEAYARRCVEIGGGWEDGVRRVDWLGERTLLIGVEVSGSNAGKEVVGKLIFV